MRPFSNVRTRSNHWPAAGWLSTQNTAKPGPPSLRAKSSTRVTVASCAFASSAASARLTIRRSGRFTSARPSASFCCCASDSRLAPLPMSKARPRSMTGVRSGRARPWSRGAARSRVRRLRQTCRRCGRRGRCPARSRQG